MPILKAAIFDMDGLLIDSEPFWRASHVAALADHGVTITVDDVRKMAGKRTDEVVNHWRKKHDLMHIPTEHVRSRVVNEVITGVQLNGKELPGVRKLIELLESHDIPIAIASSSPPQLIDAVVDKLELGPHIALAYSAVHEEYGKPHPAVFLSTSKKLHVDPSECVVFEDAISGIRAAKAAGMKCIAVPEAENLDKPEFSDEPDVTLPSLELVTWQTVTDLFDDENAI